MFSLSASADTSVESDEGNASLVFDDVFKVLLGFSKVHAFEHFSRFSGVFEMASDVKKKRVFNVFYTIFGKISRKYEIGSVV